MLNTATNEAPIAKKLVNLKKAVVTVLIVPARAANQPLATNILRWKFVSAIPDASISAFINT